MWIGFVLEPKLRMEAQYISQSVDNKFIYTICHEQVRSHEAILFYTVHGQNLYDSDT